jgi:hypothetical protein
MQRREFIAGAAATAAMNFAPPVCAQTDARSPVIKRIAIVHPSEPPEGMTINGRRAYRAYFGELNRLGYAEGRNLIVERYSALVARFSQIDGYRCLSLIRASAVVNCQSTLAWLVFRSFSQAAISSMRICLSRMRRSRHGMKGRRAPTPAYRANCHALECNAIRTARRAALPLRREKLRRARLACGC